MALSKEFTADYIETIMKEEEIPLRCLKFAPDTVTAILRYGALVGSTIEHYPRLPRGMDKARYRIREAEEKGRSFHSGTVILADEMAQSKGRFKRSWHAPKGGLWMTLALVNTLLPDSNLLVPLAVGVACCEVLRFYGIDAQIKWVNDVLADNKKIAGVLTQTFTGSRTGEEYVLAGIGINVNNEAFPAELAKNATSIKSCLHNKIRLAEIAARLIIKLRWNIGLLHYEEARQLDEYGGIGRSNEMWIGSTPAHQHLLLESYESLTDVFHRRVLFGFNVQEDPQFEAKVVGLDTSGGLIMELDDASRITRHSGEITYLD